MLQGNSHRTHKHKNYNKKKTKLGPPPTPWGGGGGHVRLLGWPTLAVVFGTLGGPLYPTMNEKTVDCDMP